MGHKGSSMQEAEKSEDPSTCQQKRTVSVRELLPKAWIEDPDDDPDPPATGPPPPKIGTDDQF